MAKPRSLWGQVRTLERRRRSASVRTTAMAKNGVSCTRKRKLFSVIGNTSQSVLARAVALRGEPSISAVSPKIPPGGSDSIALPPFAMTTSPSGWRISCRPRRLRRRSRRRARSARPETQHWPRAGVQSRQAPWSHLPDLREPRVHGSIITFSRRGEFTSRREPYRPRIPARDVDAWIHGPSPLSSGVLAGLGK